MDQKRKKNLLFLVVLAGIALASYLSIIINVSGPN